MDDDICFFFGEKSAVKQPTLHTRQDMLELIEILIEAALKAEPLKCIMPALQELRKTYTTNTCSNWRKLNPRKFVI
jgi:hypothetical protein